VLPEKGVALVDPHRKQLLAGRQRPDRGGTDDRPEQVGERKGAACSIAPASASCASQDRRRRRSRPGRPARAATASAKSRRPVAASTSVTPLAANLASVSAVTMPAPNAVGPQGPQQSALTSTRPCHWSRSWQQSRFINSFAVA
jgi:hypothetical protein